MEHLVKNDFIANPYLITQYLRGELYILIDSILSLSKNLEKDDLRNCVSFLDTFILFFIKYLDILYKYLPDVKFFFFKFYKKL